MSLTISGLIAMVLSQILGDAVSAEQIGNFIEVGGLIISALVIWFGRVRQGDIYWWGGRK